MSFDLDAEIEEIPPFVFTWRGVDYELTPLGDIPRLVLVNGLLDAVDGVEVMVRSLNIGAQDDETRAALDGMPLRVLSKLALEWQSHSGVSVGESDGSSNCSGSTEEPSTSTGGKGSTSRRK